MRLSDYLRELGIPADCLVKRSSCSERGRGFSIEPQAEDEIWRVAVDGCWQKERRRVDCLFWARSGTGRQVVVLVELKGSNYGQALDQIESTLAWLCKLSPDEQIHERADQALKHAAGGWNGVLAYVVLRTGRQVPGRRRKIPQRLSKLEKIRRRYRVRVRTRTGRLTVKGVDNLVSRAF